MHALTYGVAEAGPILLLVLKALKDVSLQNELFREVSWMWLNSSNTTEHQFTAFSHWQNTKNGFTQQRKMHHLKNNTVDFTSI